MRGRRVEALPSRRVDLATAGGSGRGETSSQPPPVDQTSFPGPVMNRSPLPSNDRPRPRTTPRHSPRSCCWREAALCHSPRHWWRHTGSQRSQAHSGWPHVVPSSLRAEITRRRRVVLARGARGAEHRAVPLRGFRRGPPDHLVLPEEDRAPVGAPAEVTSVFGLFMAPVSDWEAGCAEKKVWRDLVLTAASRFFLDALSALPPS